MTGPMLLAEVELELTAPVTIAAPEAGAGAYGALRRVAREGWRTDAEGPNAPWIPPSSLAGSFRAHVRGGLGEERAKALMGNVSEADNETDDEADQRGTPSRVRFLGTEVRLTDPDALLPVRRRTAIDRNRAAPSSGMLHASEQLPPGTTVLCHLRVDGAEHHAEVLDALRTWHPVLGSSRTTGQGGTRTRRIRHRVIDLATREGRRAWLTGGGPGLLAGAEQLEPVPAEPPEPVLTAEWEVVDALHIGTGERPPKEAAKLLRDGAGRPLVPGSTWKGVLRSRCTYILTSLGLPESEKLVCETYACGGCAMCAAFGCSPTADAPGSPGSRGSRGLLRFADSPLLDAEVRERQHVALDRVFGGAADGLLYAHEVAETGRAALRVHADGDVSPTVLAALRHALYDLHSGLTGIGGGTTRGYGTLRCTDPGAAESWRADATAHFARLLEPS